LGLGARVQHWLKSIDGLREQLVSEGIEFTNNGLILIPRRQLCALLVQHGGNKQTIKSYEKLIAG